MQDRLLIITKIKKTNEYIEKMLFNYPKLEYILKNNIESTCYEMLELAYKANIHKDAFYMREIIVKSKMLEYYIKISLDKKIISYRKLEVIGNHLLELTKMINSWIKYETSK